MHTHPTRSVEIVSGRVAARRWFTRIALLAAAAGLCQGAATTTATAAPFSCKRIDTPMTARLEGVAELVSDVVLSCTGGTPTAAGARIPEYQVLVIGNTSLPSRQALAAIGSWTPSDALLLVDDPDPDSQVVCTPVVGAISCPAWSGDESPANVFQGETLQSNGISFLQIPIDPPGPNATRMLRITNLRASPGELPAKSLPQIITNVMMYDWSGRVVSITPAQAVSAQALATMKVTPLTATGETVPDGQAPAIYTPSLIPTTNPSATYGFLLRFTEGFASAFRRRNVATSGGDPSLVAAQAMPGYQYFTESGFYNDAFPILNNLNTLGLADTGTRLRITFNKIPTGIQLWASVTEVAGSTGYSATAPKAMLTYTDSNGGEPFSAQNAWLDNWAQLSISNATTTATYEIVSADPSVVESLVFAFALTSQGGDLNTGTATMTITLAPGDALNSDGTYDLPAFLPPTTAVSTSTTTTTGTTTTTTTTTTTSTSAAVPAFSIVHSLPGQKVAMYSAVGNWVSTIAPGSLATVIIPGLAAGTALTNIAIAVVDNTGVQAVCVPQAINGQLVTCLLGSSLKPGLGVVSASSNGSAGGIGFVQIATLAPGLFSADGSGQGLASGSMVAGTGSTAITLPLAVLNSLTGLYSAQLVDPTAAHDNVYLVLNATGLAAITSKDWTYAEIGGTSVPVVSIAADPNTHGGNLVTLGPLPASLANQGLLDVLIAVDGISSNPVQVFFGTPPTE
jgi:hypothetical protein